MIKKRLLMILMLFCSMNLWAHCCTDKIESKQTLLKAFNLSKETQTQVLQLDANFKNDKQNLRKTYKKNLSKILSPAQMKIYLKKRTKRCCKK